ncbi:uncharacterized protein LAESUDRAFT_712970 [Laetiporus sulphureus 93-53]|uniref:Uncharacterized protein n=1 Tax=Laetiporus sulphureus 93-53 TaxID=1314785 RepID=A0A165F696_9APHY|nr:uncharacterized protein LAESUDRAFT_712970 [Laetiporus sulphureus 93-53]KZT08472.1 hypothetical protein LAESUDRAFT_712970 [Laetiporus sulphureus 93-53]
MAGPGDTLLALMKKRAFIITAAQTVLLADPHWSRHVLLKVHQSYEPATRNDTIRSVDGSYTLSATVLLPGDAEVPQFLRTSPIVIVEHFIGTGGDPAAPNWVNWPPDTVWVVRISRRAASQTFKELAEYPENLEVPGLCPSILEWAKSIWHKGCAPIDHGNPGINHLQLEGISTSVPALFAASVALQMTICTYAIVQYAMPP